jgi:apolipoprotein N-acyltransferase
VAAVVAFTRGKNRLIGIGITAAVLGLPFVLPLAPGTKHFSSVRISGVQLEFREEDVVSALDRVVKLHPDTDLFVLSEYTFSGSPPREVRDWCKEHRTYLVAGGKDDTPDNFYNTAFVVGPSGKVVFKQAKSVPIQFFKDGLPAKEQKLWQSPWGKIGICICYDFSYRRVVDNLIEQGAQMLIVPTMDVVEWGDYQHRLHARVAPIHAAEFGVPIFRLCSSGISQAVVPFGPVVSTAPFPGEGAIISAVLKPVHSETVTVPLDHHIAPMAVIGTGMLVIYFSVIALRRKRPQTQNT